MGQTKPIPKGLHTVTPNLVLRDCARAIQFYQRALGAKELMRMPSPDGQRIWHAELKIGDSIIYLSDEMPGGQARAPTASEPAAMSIQLYVEDCDDLFARAVKAGARSTHPLEDMFWGDRMGTVADPFGYQWTIGTHVRDVPQKEMEKAIEAMRRSRPGDTDEESGTFRQAEAEERERHLDEL
jgi:uncharacterized glyoxalase superfamily protein PhnB